MEYPDGYLEAQAAKKQSKEAETDGGAGSEEEADNKGKRGRKRKAPGMLCLYTLVCDCRFRFIAFNFVQTPRLLVPLPRRASNLGTS